VPPDAQDELVQVRAHLLGGRGPGASPAEIDSCTSERLLYAGRPVAEQLEALNERTAAARAATQRPCSATWTEPAVGSPSMSAGSPPDLARVAATDRPASCSLFSARSSCWPLSGPAGADADEKVAQDRHQQLAALGSSGHKECYRRALYGWGRGAGKPAQPRWAACSPGLSEPPGQGSPLGFSEPAALAVAQ